ncbi:hypothetical protein [Methanofollis fontis]|uniref:hypothetical protein n=1 Tax=Methanofollis fontis TaxID=2052832 RepID=UPI00102EE186|nr:hypothetical protein [Methanofollis fontis]
MISTRTGIAVSTAGLLLALTGLTLAWSGAVGETDPASLVPVLAGGVLILLPAVLRTWSEDQNRLPKRSTRIIWCAAVIAGTLVGGGILSLWLTTAGDPKLHNLASPVLAACAGVFIMVILEKTAIRILEHRT